MCVVWCGMVCVRRVCVCVCVCVSECVQACARVCVYACVRVWPGGGGVSVRARLEHMRKRSRARGTYFF